MTLTRFTPRFSLFRDFDDFFRDLGVPVYDNHRQAALVPPADVVETDTAVELRLDLPGVDPEQIEVKLDGNMLTISAERKNERTEGSKGWIRQERAWGTFSRTFTIPNTVDGAHPEAAYKHGVLTVTLPKKEEVVPRTLKVKVEG
jgi:HSP20 family protein